MTDVYVHHVDGTARGLFRSSSSHPAWAPYPAHDCETIIPLSKGLKRDFPFSPQGTGKGFGSHRVSHPKKDTTNHLLNYEKLVPGYAEMSRPQKYRARKHIKQVAQDHNPPPFRDPSSRKSPRQHANSTFPKPPLASD